jgi:hypothetical protein
LPDGGKRLENKGILAFSVQRAAGVINHFHWAGLDFMFDRGGTPYLLEANRCSHMLREYVAAYGDFEPFRLAAAAMNEAGGLPCLLWRRQDLAATDEENAAWIGSCLSRFLHRPPAIAFVEENSEDRAEMLTREGTWVRPGSLFRWWYPLSWSFERAGMRVLNPNAVWVVVRDKLASYHHLSAARHFRVPWSAAVGSAHEAAEVIAGHGEWFAEGFVLKPRTGFGGHGVRVGAAGSVPAEVPENAMLCERVVPPLDRGCFWDVRCFVMAGKYCGGLVRTSDKPVTNVFQGGRTSRLPEALAARLEPAALEAVALLDDAAAAVHALPQPPDSPLVRVVW